MTSRLQKQIEFISKIDGLKDILRSNKTLNGDHRENSAEHSWSVGLMAHILAEHSDLEIDVDRVCKMLLVHDIVETETGDTFRYDESGTIDQHEREAKAAEKIFGLLPDEQRDDFRGLWDEFEELKTNEARFVKALDHLAAVIHNSANAGGSWAKFGISEKRIKENNKLIAIASHSLGKYAMQLISEIAEKGCIKKYFEKFEPVNTDKSQC